MTRTVAGPGGRGSREQPHDRRVERSPTPSNLPQPLTSFAGRAQELREIKGLLASARLVSLVGPGGIGKSRLALETAQRSLRSFPDGVWYLDLSGLDHSRDVGLAILEALAVRQLPSLTPTQLLIDAMGRGRMLLVIDDCERHLEELTPVVAALLGACPNLRVLATTRHRFGISGEATFDVPGLGIGGAAPRSSGGDAAALFVARVRAHDRTFSLTERTARLVGELCERLDGMPLAIELAAARARHFELEDLVARLSDQPALLRGGPRLAPARQRSLAATVEWSMASVSAGAMALFSRLAVFRGGFDLDAAGAVAHDEAGARVESLLLELIDASLVRRDAGVRGRTRYRLLEPLRQEAGVRLDGEGNRASVDDRHARHYAGVAAGARDVEHTSVEPLWLDVFESEHQNLRAALEWLLQNDADRALELTADLAMFWVRRGYANEARSWLDRCVHAAHSDVHRDRALFALSMIVSMRDDATAARLAKRAHDLAVAHDHPAVEAMTSVLVAQLSMDDPTGADELFQEAAAAAHRSGRREVEIAVLAELADMEWLHGQRERGTAHAREALAAARDLDAPSLVVLPASILARSSAWTGSSNSEALFAESLGAARELGDIDLIGYCLSWLAILSAWRGDIVGAVESLRDAAGAYRRTGNRIGKLHAIEQTGLLLIEVGRVADGVRLIREKRRLEGDKWLDSPQWTSYVDGELERATALIGDGSRLDSDPEDTRSTEQLFADSERALSLLASWAHAREATDSDRLTRRETEVVQLVEHGLTNREIGQRLTISERTAEAHVLHIMNKLGLSNRAQVAAWAVTNREGTAPRAGLERTAFLTGDPRQEMAPRH